MPNTTPLLNVLRHCTVPEQHELAKLAGTKRNYLYQMASCHRKEFSALLAMRVATATAIMHATSTGRIPKITAEEIASMCLIK